MEVGEEGEYRPIATLSPPEWQGCFHSHISTQTFQRALTASVDSCAEIKSAPSVTQLNLAEFGGRCRKTVLGVWVTECPLHWLKEQIATRPSMNLPLCQYSTVCHMPTGLSKIIRTLCIVAGYRIVPGLICFILFREITVLVRTWK